MMKLSNLRICVITGLSGSGKSTAVRALEDEGFFCLDNLPPALLTVFIEFLENSPEKVTDVAVVIDIRTKDFFKGKELLLQELRDKGHQVDIFFLDASNEILARRFSETRRRHPAALTGSVQDGILYERKHLAGLQQIATTIIDTSDLNVHQLKELVADKVRGKAAGALFNLHLQSFGYRYGVPAESDLVMDVRFLTNPHFIPELAPLTGLDQEIRKYLLEKQDTTDFLDHFLSFIDFLIPRYKREGKSYLTISIGCTGGRHRSVTIVEVLRDFFSSKDLVLKVTHRDIEKG